MQVGAPPHFDNPVKRFMLGNSGEEKLTSRVCKMAWLHNHSTHSGRLLVVGLFVITCVLFISSTLAENDFRKFGFHPQLNHINLKPTQTRNT